MDGDGCRWFPNARKQRVQLLCQSLLFCELPGLLGIPFCFPRLFAGAHSLLVRQCVGQNDSSSSRSSILGYAPRRRQWCPSHQLDQRRPEALIQPSSDGVWRSTIFIAASLHQRSFIAVTKARKTRTKRIASPAAPLNFKPQASNSMRPHLTSRNSTTNSAPSTATGRPIVAAKCS